MLSRKNLVVDADRVRRLATRLRTTQSAAVRRAVDALLMEDEVLGAARRLRERGTLRDVYGRATRPAR